jgi:hypothetical protein
VDSIPQSPILCACGCGTPIPPRKDGKHYRFHHGHGTAKRVDTTCAQCGAAIRVHAWRLEKFGRAYCNHTCGLSKIRQITTPCAWCNNPVIHTPSRKHGAHVFCNVQCHWRWWEARPDNKVTYTCAQCDKQWLDYPSYNRGNAHYFCSKACRAVFIIGTNNPAYTSGRGRRGVYGPNWKQQRRAAVLRDQGKCQICLHIPKQARALHVHHIIPFYQFHGDYETANQLTNLLALCAKCHKQAEHGKVAVQAKLL